MSCPFGHDDAAYVLGALSTAERLEFERHLAGCEDCTRAVCELAGLPGLLSRIDSEVLTVSPPADEAVPDSLLPGLARAARRARRRRVLGVAGAAAAAAAVVASVGVSQVDLGDDEPPGKSSEQLTVLTMVPVGQVPVEADLAMEGVLWGTKLELTCTYDTASVPYKLPPAVDYVIVVRTEDGDEESVGSWRSVDGRTMTLNAGTAVEPGDISSVEVRTPDGRVVLHSTA